MKGWLKFANIDAKNMWPMYEYWRLTTIETLLALSCIKIKPRPTSTEDVNIAIMRNLWSSIVYRLVLDPNRKAGCAISIIPINDRMVSVRLILLKHFWLYKLYFVVECLNKIDKDGAGIVQGCNYTDW